MTALLHTPPPVWQEIPSPTVGARAFRLGRLAVLVSTASPADGSTWYHVSVSHRDRIPLYEELAKVKKAFIGAEREALQVFPREDQHVNHHPRCLHLWSRLDGPVMPDLRKYEPVLGELSV